MNLTLHERLGSFGLLVPLHSLHKHCRHRRQQLGRCLRENEAFRPTEDSLTKLTKPLLVCCYRNESKTSAVLDYLKMSFTTGNKTGCRFLIVDAYNNEKVTNFYHKNGFRYLTGEDVGDTTRIMYFDLIRFIR